MREHRIREALKAWLKRLLALPLGQCLPALALCLLLCCTVTGFAVLRMEQKTQFRRDTIVVVQPQDQLTASQTTQKAAPAPTVADEPEGEKAPAAMEEQKEETAAPRTELVYASPSGKRYHYDPICPGKNGQEVTWDEVERRGLTPCKKCVK